MKPLSPPREEDEPDGDDREQQGTERGQTAHSSTTPRGRRRTLPLRTQLSTSLSAMRDPPLLDGDAIRATRGFGRPVRRTARPLNSASTSTGTAQARFGGEQRRGHPMVSAGGPEMPPVANRPMETRARAGEPRSRPCASGDLKTACPRLRAAGFGLDGGTPSARVEDRAVRSRRRAGVRSIGAIRVDSRFAQLVPPVAAGDAVPRTSVGPAGAASPLRPSPSPTGALGTILDRRLPDHPELLPAGVARLMTTGAAAAAVRREAQRTADRAGPALAGTGAKRPGVRCSLAATVLATGGRWSTGRLRRR